MPNLTHPDFATTPRLTYPFSKGQFHIYRSARNLTRFSTPKQQECSALWFNHPIMSQTNPSPCITTALSYHITVFEVFWGITENCIAFPENNKQKKKLLSRIHVGDLSSYVRESFTLHGILQIRENIYLHLKRETNYFSLPTQLQL